MNRTSLYTKSSILVLGLLVAIFQYGCAPTASKTVRGAGTGAAVGAIGAAAAGGDGETMAAAGVAGAAVGAIIGQIQEGRERKKQDNLAQQRLYNQSIAIQRKEEEKQKAQLQEELDIAEGFRISETELNEVTSRAEKAEEELKALQARKQAALERKQQLDEMEEREEEALREIERLKRELAELEGISTTGEG